MRLGRNHRRWCFQHIIVIVEGRTHKSIFMSVHDLNEQLLKSNLSQVVNFDKVSKTIVNYRHNNITTTSIECFSLNRLNFLFELNYLR